LKAEDKSREASILDEESKSPARSIREDTGNQIKALAIVKTKSTYGKCK